jgi:hypothetical protein
VVVDHHRAFGPQPAGVLDLDAGHETAGAGDDPPPRHVLVGHPQVVPHRARRLREPGLPRHLAVGHDLTGYERAQHAQHPTFEGRHSSIFPESRRVPMSDVPEADAIEQAEVVDPAPETAGDAKRLPDDAPEADALEQAEEVPPPGEERDDRE